MRRREFVGLAAGSALMGMQGYAHAGSSKRATLAASIIEGHGVLPPDSDGYQTVWLESLETTEDGESCYEPYALRVTQEGLEIEGDDGQMWTYAQGNFSFDQGCLHLQESPSDEYMTSYTIAKASELVHMDGDSYDYLWLEVDQATADGAQAIQAYAYRVTEAGLEIEDDNAEFMWTYPEGLYDFDESSIWLADNPRSEYLTEYTICKPEDLDIEDEEGFRTVWLEHDTEVCADGRTTVYSYQIKFEDERVTIRYDETEEVYGWNEFDLAGGYLYLAHEGEEDLWGYRICHECDLDIDVA